MVALLQFQKVISYFLLLDLCLMIRVYLSAMQRKMYRHFWWVYLWNNLTCSQPFWLSLQHATCDTQIWSKIQFIFLFREILTQTLHSFSYGKSFCWNPHTYTHTTYYQAEQEQGPETVCKHKDRHMHCVCPTDCVSSVRFSKNRSAVLWPLHTAMALHSTYTYHRRLAVDPLY